MAFVPEGPTIILLREQIARCEGKNILRATGGQKRYIARRKPA